MLKKSETNLSKKKTKQLRLSKLQTLSTRDLKRK